MSSLGRKVLDLAEQQGLLDSQAIADLRRQVEQSKFIITPEAIAKVLVDQGHLTPFQARKLVAQALGPEPDPVEKKIAEKEQTKKRKTPPEELTFAEEDDDSKPSPATPSRGWRTGPDNDRPGGVNSEKTGSLNNQKEGVSVPGADKTSGEKPARKDKASGKSPSHQGSPVNKTPRKGQDRGAVADEDDPSTAEDFLPPASWPESCFPDKSAKMV